MFTLYDRNAPRSLVPCCNVRCDLLCAWKLYSVRLYSHLIVTIHVLSIICIQLCILAGVQHNFHIARCSCRVTVTRQMALVLQELLTPGFCGGGGFVLLNLWVLNLWIIVIVLCIFSLSNCIVYSFSIYNFWGGVQLPYDHGHDGLLMNKIQWEDKQTVNDTITGVVLKKYPKFNFISNNIPFVVLGYNDNHSIIPSSHPISV